MNENINLLDSDGTVDDEDEDIDEIILLKATKKRRFEELEKLPNYFVEGKG
jgi:hypothetical protein